MVLLEVYNMSYANSTHGISLMTSWLPIIAITLAGAIVLGLILTAVSFWWFRKVMDFINGFTGTIKYALYGVTTIGCFGVVSFGILQFLSWNNENNIPLWYYPLSAVGYAVLYVVGRVSEGVYQRLEKNFNKMKRR